MKVTLHPGAVADLQEAAAFYEREGSPALAASFLSEFRRVSRLLTEQPAIGSPRSGGRRGFPMGIFPYTLIYRAKPDETAFWLSSMTEGVLATAPSAGSASNA